jgi:hypothetical protein
VQGGTGTWGDLPLGFVSVCIRVFKDLKGYEVAQPGGSAFIVYQGFAKVLGLKKSLSRVCKIKTLIKPLQTLNPNKTPTNPKP